MAEVILIRHGQADYDCLRSRRFPVSCAGLAPLTEKGIAQAQAVASDKRLSGSEIIVASPFTRALQTASIIAHHTGLKIEIEFDLHEWLPDTTFKMTDESEFDSALKAFTENKGLYNGHDFIWEQITDIKKRACACLSKYSAYSKIIVVTHEEVICSLTGKHRIENCGIVEAEL